MEGVEPTPEFASIASKRNNSIVKNQSYDGFSLAEYDLVTLVHVLEHTQSPWKFMELIGENMKSGAYLYLETPSIEDIDALDPDYDRFMSPHNYLFSKEFVSGCLFNVGLHALSINYAITKLGKVDPHAQ
jgi:2-polyprenyl-3-methyl-5-hydroxy-6-metoxy-1,4-benzoquinol methylase